MILLECSEENGPCKCEGLGQFVESLMKHEYEICHTKFQAADYGPVRSQERHIALASRIGLPKLPRTPSIIYFAHPRLQEKTTLKLKNSFNNKDSTAGTKCVEVLKNKSVKFGRQCPSIG
jgi:hypothetical protein